MGERKPTYLEVKKNAQAIHKGLSRVGARRVQEIYHNLMSYKDDEVHEQ